MTKEISVNLEDKQKVLSWMNKNCLGFRNALTRADILLSIKLPDRYFRRVISELKHEGHIASTCSRGYWAIPLLTNDKEEIEAALDSYREMKSKALDLLTGLDQQIKRLEDRRSCLTQQFEFAGVGN
ncbi:MAG: hypothetical protein WC364_13755 [Eubacteriales bacterium]|jgi:hypothetical protein